MYLGTALTRTCIKFNRIGLITCCILDILIDISYPELSVLMPVHNHNVFFTRNLTVRHHPLSLFIHFAFGLHLCSVSFSQYKPSIFSESRTVAETVDNHV